MTLYKAVKPKRISEQVFEQVRDLIFRGQLKAGERLLPERDLAEALGVSRPTVREAINMLVVRGLVEQHQGQGTFICSPEPGQAHNPLKNVIDGHDASLLELLEVRLGLECNAAVLAARRATTEDINLMLKAFEQMKVQIESGELGFSEDTHFHMCVAYASKNPVQIHIMKNLYDLLHFGIKENLAHLYEDPANIQAVLDQHYRVLQAIEAHDTQAAFEAMRLHIGFVIDFFARQTPA
ncbi:MAG: FadR family transcriptional regulator [Deltaproteobacteria bacterium]|nr:FadR family transcriptional regulator [Deltaproteobacteria bacterium]